MSSIASAVFKATIGLLINKARDTTAEKLREGDVTDEKFRSLIVREIDQINSKLDGLARKDLLSSINTFKEGIAILFDVFKQGHRGVKELKETDVTGQATTEAAEMKDIAKVSLRQSSASAQAEAVSLTHKLGNLQLIDLDESSKELLSDAKERFKEARSKATDAFSNEVLNTPDRILAMMVRVMATILEKVDNPANALTPCRVCLDQLHALPAVKKSFKIALAKGLTSWFGRDERKEIIAAVCDINHAIFDVTLMVGCNSLIWPLIDVGAGNIHPLRDPRVTAINQQSVEYIGYYPMQWSLGMKFVQSARGICTNTKGQFIVGDVDGYENIKVFGSDGNFLYAVKICEPAFCCDVATDQADNVYVLCKDTFQEKYHVCIFDKDNNMHGRFVVDELKALRLIVVEKNSKQVLVLGKQNPISHIVANVYEVDGTFIRRLLWPNQFLGVRYHGSGITACNDGRVMVLDRGQVCVFSAEGDDCQYMFSVGQETNQLKNAEAILWANEHVIIVSMCERLVRSSDFDVSIYTEDGKLVYNFPISSCYQYCRIECRILGITMNRQGRIALALRDDYGREILVF